MTPEWALAVVALGLARASATLSLGGEQEAAQQFDRLAVLLVAFITVMKRTPATTDRSARHLLPGAGDLAAL